MLNTRQMQMIKDLQNSLVRITANQLALKYGVSLRTVRSDINEIAKYLEENHIDFLRVPGRGMQIIGNTKTAVEFNQPYRNKDYPYLENRFRFILILFHFLFMKGPVSSVALCEDFDVSKGTVISSVRSLNRTLRSFNLSIDRFQNKGYCLNGTLKNIVKASEAIARECGEEAVFNTMSIEENGFINEEELKKLNETLRYISYDLSLYIQHPYYLAFLLYVILSQHKDTERSKKNRNKQDKADQLILHLEEVFPVRLNKEACDLIKYLLNTTTDYSSNTDTLSHGDLSAAIDSMIDHVNSSGLYLVEDREVLKSDLQIHLRSTIEAIKLGLPRENPLLDDIRNSYPNEFNLIKSACQKFSSLYPLELDDHEVGYITLYFLRSFDKTEKIHETNVMVVCNTGRSASKLLATRLINNIPNIHIVSMNSIYSINNDPKVFDHVDFIISTIPLPKVDKPHVVISPLLQKAELSKVKEAIWLAKSEVETSVPVDEVASQMLEEQKNSGNKDRNLVNKEYYDARNLVPYNVTALLGEVSMNLFTLITELYPKGIPASKYNNVSGVFAHIIMSIPRWQRGAFIEAADEKEMIENNRKQYIVIRRYLIQESERLGIFIPDSEAIAILRYYVY